MRGTVCHSTSRPVTSVAGENEEAVVVEASAQAGGGSQDDPLGTVLDQLRQGRPILVVGPGERDTAAVLAAESCTAEMAQWLIRNGTGIIAAPIEASRAEAANVEERAAAKQARDFARADAIRDQLAGEGIALEDTPQGVRWTRKRT